MRKQPGVRYRPFPMAADGSGWTMIQPPEQGGFRHACCGCGLIHDIELRVVNNWDLKQRWRVNNRATAAHCRQHKYF